MIVLEIIQNLYPSGESFFLSIITLVFYYSNSYLGYHYRLY